MHECLTVQGWMKAWGDPDAGAHRLATCPRCATHRGHIDSWLQAVSECDDCRASLEATPLEDAEVLACPRCMAALDRLHELLDDLEHFEPSVASELLAADELSAKLAPLSTAAQVARVTDDLRYQQWGLVQTLLRASREAWSDDRELAHARAVVAATLADLLDPETYQAEWTADLRAKAHAYLANTHRILADFRAAEREFAVAEGHLWQGVGSGRSRAQVFSLKASLLVDQRRYVEAGLLLDSVLEYYRLAEDAEAIARTHLQKAMVAAGTGDFSGAVADCERAASDLNAERHPRLFALAHQNAVEYLIHGGEIERARRLFERLPAPVNRSMELRRAWIEGNLYRAEGAAGAARVAYETARIGMVENGRHYLAALVSLEEAALALDEDNSFEALAMAQEASILLVRGAARQEALAALRVLLTALERGAADQALVLTLLRKIAALQPSG